MLTNEVVKEIQLLKGTAALSTKFIKKFDREWEEAVSRIRGSGVDLSGMVLIAHNVEYKNVRI